MKFTQSSQIYVNGLGEWFRIIDQTDDKVRLVNSEGRSDWQSKAKIEALMEKDEPSLCTDGLDL